MSDLVFDKSQGVLLWGSKRFRAISGPYGKKALPSGKYLIKRRNVVVGGHLSSSYRDNITGKAWFIPIKPTFNTNRAGFGIHPDGNTLGTLGCIGLKAEDTSSFWKQWNNTLMSARPDSLTVK